MHSGFEVSSSICWIYNMVCVWQHLKPPGFWKFTHGCASRKAVGREIKSIPTICLPQWIKHHLPPMIGEVNIFNLSPWNISISKTQHRLLCWRLGTQKRWQPNQACERNVMTFTPHRAFIPAAMAILCIVTMNMKEAEKEAEWLSQDRSYVCWLRRIPSDAGTSVGSGVVMTIFIFGLLCEVDPRISPKSPQSPIFQVCFSQGLGQQRQTISYCPCIIVDLYLRLFFFYTVSNQMYHTSSIRWEYFFFSFF